MQAVAAERDIAIVASYALAGGVLTGKYDHDPQAGRAAGLLNTPRYSAAVAAGRELVRLAAELGRDPAQLAFAFALGNPAVTTVLFGATRPDQIRSNVAALDVTRDLSPETRSKLAAIGV
jgi:L-glyceraldehyde 3-phosphate reductase